MRNDLLLLLEREQKILNLKPCSLGWLSPGHIWRCDVRHDGYFSLFLQPIYFSTKFLERPICHIHGFLTTETVQITLGGW